MLLVLRCQLGRCVVGCLDQMLNALEVFKAFYVSKHSGRRLMWQHSLGSCVLRANFPHVRRHSFYG